MSSSCRVFEVFPRVREDQLSIFLVGKRLYQTNKALNILKFSMLLLEIAETGARGGGGREWAICQMLFLYF